MAKAKSTYVCQNCGTQSPKWVGRCHSCGEWNTYVEEIQQPANEKRSYKPAGEKRTAPQPQRISEIALEQQPRLQLGDGELDRVLGGGLVPGSLVLIGGEPGIGKSTLMLQVAVRLPNTRVLYVSGEESEQQIRMRADRIGMKNTDCFILTETNTQNIFARVRELKPQVLVIDSIQTLHTANAESSPGSVGQVRECTGELLRFAKETGTPVFLIGHITKEGSIAGPKVLEHMVDTVLQFEGDRHHVYRLLRSAKNRFGSTNELGIYEMQGSGLRTVSNPSEVLISSREEARSGTAIAAMLEGMRPLLVEIQALVSSAVYGTPQRSSTGYDLRRLNMLLAVLEKRCGFKLGAKDVFLNIAGGIRVDDPGIDLAVVCAIMSSNADLPLPPNVCFAAEVGLAGEIRPVNRIEQRLSEAEKLGFARMFISKGNKKGLDPRKYKMELVFVDTIEAVLRGVFG